MKYANKTTKACRTKEQEEIIEMTGLDIFHMYRPQIIELAVICQDMNRKEYESWKAETMKATPMKAAGFMGKVIMIVSAFRKAALSGKD